MLEIAAPSHNDSPPPNNIPASDPLNTALVGRILVVEDDYLISMEIEHTLTTAGFDVAVVASGEQALIIAAAERPALTIMDIRLAGRMDGVDTALQLFQTYGLRSIFASAHSDSSIQARAAPAAPLGWLVKPYSPASLLAAVQAAFRSLQPPP